MPTSSGRVIDGGGTGSSRDDEGPALGVELETELFRLRVDVVTPVDGAPEAVGSRPRIRRR